jgi:hypothetical protein
METVTGQPVTQTNRNQVNMIQYKSTFNKKPRCDRTRADLKLLELEEQCFWEAWEQVGKHLAAHPDIVIDMTELVTAMMREKAPEWLASPRRPCWSAIGVAVHIVDSNPSSSAADRGRRKYR